MLMDIKCSAVTSVAVHLLFDDNTTKDVVIANNDLIIFDYNYNGLRKHFEGKVININTTGVDPKKWSIIVDGSGDFESDKARVCPMNILDIEVIRKGDNVRYIETTNDQNGIMGMRILYGKLQYTLDGFHWNYINEHHHDNGIKDEEGTSIGTYSSEIIKDETN